MHKLKIAFKVITLIFWTITLPTVIGLYLWTCKRDEILAACVIAVLLLGAAWLMYYVNLVIAGIKETRK